MLEKKDRLECEKILILEAGMFSECSYIALVVCCVTI